MMRQFHELRRHEEGQALVLAAISMLVLCLCVLATANIAFAAKEKIRLQNAADAGAYSMAAYEARALNFFAYSNRSMVVHYASMMNLMASLSYLSFARAVLKALGLIPYIGVIFRIWERVMYVVQLILEVAAVAGIIALDGCNFFLSLVQWGVSNTILARAALAAPAEVQRYNPNYVPFALAGLAGAASWAGIVDTNPIPFGRGSAAEDRLNRAFMTEIANSARHRWTVDGSPNGRSWTLAGIPRQAQIGQGGGFFVFQIGKVARTEYGSFNTVSSSFWSQLTTSTDEVYSIDSFVITVGFRGVFTVTLRLDATAVANRRLGEHQFGRFVLDFTNCGRWNFLCKTVRSFVKPLVERAISSALQSISSESGHKVHFHFGQMPYARFRPSASGRSLFAQPATVVLVSMPTAALQAMGRPFIGRFGGNLGLSSAGSRLSGRGGGWASADQRRTVAQPRRGYTTAVDFAPGARPFSILPAGLNAVSAAVAYYHRPGDWREPPNLFNPFWGAKLIPVVDHPLIASNDLLRPLLAGPPSTRLLVH